MKLVSIFSVIVFLLLPIINSTVQYNDTTYLFVLRYAISVCNNPTSVTCVGRTESPILERFTIRGLWRVHENGTTNMSPCVGPDLTELQLQDIWEDLIKSWPSYTAKTHFGLWNEAWDLHGKCIASTANEYFKMAIKLNDQLNLSNLIAPDGPIVPDDSFQYPLCYFRDAIQERTLVPPLIYCNNDKDGTKQLSQVRVCVNLLKGLLIKCPFPATGGC